MLRAVGIVRVSQPKGRKGESFVSPKEQRQAIIGFCAEKGWRITDDDIYDELKVSGDPPWRIGRASHEPWAPFSPTPPT
jgi:hypothetical protein